jgi:hypothetical protein
MFKRVVITAVSVLLLSACDEGSKNQEAKICKGLSEADCTAKTECSWNADKGRCKVAKEDRMEPEQSAPPAQSEQAPPEQSAPPAASEPTPPEQSAPPAPAEAPTEPPE